MMEGFSAIMSVGGTVRYRFATFIKLRDFVCSSRGSISVLRADITPEWNHIGAESGDKNELGEMAVLSEWEIKRKVI